MPARDVPGSADLVIGRPGEATVSFGQPDLAVGGSARVPVGLSAGGLSSLTTLELADWSDGVTRFIGYFEELSTHWRGWDGAREFGDDGPNVALSAVHDGVGLVRLRITAEPLAGWDGPGAWRLWVVVPVEPGSLASIAERIRSLFDGSRT